MTSLVAACLIVATDTTIQQNEIVYNSDIRHVILRLAFVDLST